MKRRAWIAGLGATAGLLGPPTARAAGAMTVFAAASLREAFESAAPDFRLRTQTSVQFSFAGSDTLVTQLTQGAPADVFASANEAQMVRARDAGLLAGEPQTLARNRIVVVLPEANRAGILRIADLARARTRVALAAPTVPVGAYARATMAKLAGTRDVPADFATAVERNVVSNELDVRAVLAKVVLGEADAGIVYVTDITPNVERQVRTIAIPREAVPDIIYPIARLKSAANPVAADAFIAFMRGPGNAALRARGFLMP